MLNLVDGLAIKVSLPVSGKCKIKMNKTKTYCPDMKFIDLANPAAGVERKQISSFVFTFHAEKNHASKTENKQN